LTNASRKRRQSFSKKLAGSLICGAPVEVRSSTLGYTGTGTWRVRVRVKVWTPVGLPVLMPTYYLIVHSEYLYSLMKLLNSSPQCVKCRTKGPAIFSDHTCMFEIYMIL
jgi:hypothetical protein